jgi:hypothetical protein
MLAILNFQVNFYSQKHFKKLKITKNHNLLSVDYKPKVYV